MARRSGELGRFVVVLEDLLFIFGHPVDEDAADDDELLGLVLRDDPASTLSATALATAYWAGPNILGRPACPP